MSNLELPQRSNSLLSDNQSEKLQISVSCRNLADLDTFSVTDSFLIIRLQQHNKPTKQILKTKTYWNDLNPNYAQTAIVEFFFQIRQTLIFQVYHDDNPVQLVGKVNSTIGQIFGSSDNGVKLSLQNKQGKQTGKIIIRCQKITKQHNRQVILTIGAESLPSFLGFSCCCSLDPFFRVFRKGQTDDILVYQSQVIYKHSNPVFKQFQISQRRLSKANSNRPFQIKFYDHSSWGSHKLIGSSTIKVDEIDRKKNFAITDNGSNRGVCLLRDVKIFNKYQFGDFIQAGLQLALVTCIDFTGSNGIPTSPQSLHYMNGHRPSPYAQALTQVSKILLDYDYDKLVPVYGFGAKVKMPNLNTGGKVHHCFPINGNNQNPNLYQVEGVLEGYRKCLPHLQFAGPTLFSGLLREAIHQCKQFQREGVQYMILFILTDGQINDQNEVIDLIISCCKLPISIIIVGIGNGDFGIMNKLDDDDKQMRDSKGNGNIRDLVQFVQFSKFGGNGIQLAKEVLEELPRQVVEYFQLIGKQPKDIKNQKNDIQFQIQSTLIKRK